MENLLALGNKLIKEFDNMYKDFDYGFTNNNLNYNINNINYEICEASDAFNVWVELPGITKENITLVYSDGFLTVEAKKIRDNPIREETQHYKTLVNTRGFGKFSCRLKVSKLVNESRITSNLHDGVLFVHIPKLKETDKSSVKIKIE